MMTRLSCPVTTAPADGPRYAAVLIPTGNDGTPGPIGHLWWDDVLLISYDVRAWDRDNALAVASVLTGGDFAEIEYPGEATR